MAVHALAPRGELTWRTRSLLWATETQHTRDYVAIDMEFPMGA